MIFMVVQKSSMGFFMRLCVSEFVSKVAQSMLPGDDSGYSESPYLNIPIYQKRMDPSDPSQEIGMGPPSDYNDTDPETDKLKNIEDIRRQGVKPGLSDQLEYKTQPITVTVIGNPREDCQGEEYDTTTPKGRNENRDTINFDEGTLLGDPFP